MTISQGSTLGSYPQALPRELSSAQFRDVHLRCSKESWYESRCNFLGGALGPLFGRKGPYGRLHSAPKYDHATLYNRAEDVTSRNETQRPDKRTSESLSLTCALKCLDDLGHVLIMQEKPQDDLRFKINP